MNEMEGHVDNDIDIASASVITVKVGTPVQLHAHFDLVDNTYIPLGDPRMNQLQVSAKTTEEKRNAEMYDRILHVGKAKVVHKNGAVIKQIRRFLYQVTPFAFAS